MIGKNAAALFHQPSQQIAARAARIIVQHRFIGQIVRRRGAGVVRKRRRLFRPAIHQQIAIADAGIKLQPLAADAVPAPWPSRSRGFLGRNMPGGEIAHRLVFDRHQIAANGPIVRAKLNSLRRGFQRRTAGEMLHRVVAEQAQARDIGTGRQRRRHVVRSADDASCDDCIHRRRAGRLQRRFAAERLLRLIGSAVGNDDGVFHKCRMLVHANSDRYRCRCACTLYFTHRTRMRTLIGRALGRRSMASTAACTFPSVAVCVMITSGTKPSSVRSSSC